MFSADFSVLQMKQCLSFMMKCEIHFVNSFHCSLCVSTCDHFYQLHFFFSWLLVFLDSQCTWKSDFRHVEARLGSNYNNGSPLWSHRLFQQIV